MDQYTAERWNVPQETWRPLVDSADTIKASWVDFSNDPRKPSVGLVVFARDGFVSGGAFNAPVLVPCAVDARWVPVRMWIDPKVDNSIHEDHNNVLDTTYGADPHPFPRAVSGTQRISFHQEYIDTLATPIDSTNRSAIESIISRHFARLQLTVHLDVIASSESICCRRPRTSAINRHWIQLLW